ncbi:MAG: DUF262 domain-containing protein [Flavobacteriales bacterium]|nr:DUF262 domain-containing protein [Flavobacteriales bacterium]
MQSAIKEKLQAYFQHGLQYQVPFFQRTYVWGETNWENLLEHVEVEVKAVRDGKSSEHFIGTIITKPLPQENLSTQLMQLVDGQQRLTTVAIALKALADTASTTGEFSHLRSRLIGMLTFQDSRGQVHLRIKHSRVDEEAFEMVMRANTIAEVPDAENNISKAYHYFAGRFSVLDDERRDQFAGVILQRLPVIAMLLNDNDDEQEIFDTINSLGERLTTAELLKNHLFREPDMRELYDTHWFEVFEEDEDDHKFWGTTKSAGRVKRTNLELLLYSVLIIETGEEVSIEKLFTRYKAWLKDKSKEEQKNFLARLKAHAETYRAFPSEEELAQLTFSDAERRLFHVIDFLEITTIYPLLLFVFEQVKEEDERRAMLSMMECYLVRRLVCRLTSKNYNRSFIQLINELRQAGTIDAAALRTIIQGYGEDTTRLPQDLEFEKAFGTAHLYNAYALEVLFLIALKKLNPRLSDRNVLSAEGFSVEHMMPKKWREHWSKTGMTPDDQLARDQKLKTLGNLTLVKQPLNSSMRNSSWSKKRKALKTHSLLNITTDYLDLDTWDENAIQKRAGDLAKDALGVWPMI